MRTRILSIFGTALLATFVTAACGDDESEHDHDHDAGDEVDGGTTNLANTLFVAREGSLVSFDIATGEERPGTLTNVTGPVDLQSLANGTLLVNLTGRNEILALDPATMLEEARIPSSAAGGTRPVHSFLSPVREGAQVWLTLNDGDGTAPSNTATIVDVTPGSDTWLEAVGEFDLGIGHHKASYSNTADRVVISNIGDCDNVMTVYDYSDRSDIQAVETLTAEEAGWDGLSFPRNCDPTYQTGLPPAPHGCATSPLSGKAYCNLTTSGEMVVVDIDADPPTFEILATEGSGGGYTVLHPGGRYAYTMQEGPREGDGGVACQIGAVSVTDTMTDTVVTTLPVRYTGPDCAEALTGTDEETANPAHAYFSHDGDVAYLALGGGFEDADARVRQLVVLDTSDPAAPVQEASIAVGTHTGHGTAAVDGSGEYLFLVNAVDGTVSQVEIASGTVIATLDVGDDPAVAATFGTAEGPSHQTGPVEAE
jgi:hypothetical protein